MAVKKEFKLTEIGYVPSDWQETDIGSVANKVGSGITPKGGNSNYQSFGRPFVRSQNVGRGKLLLRDLAFITEDTHKSFSSTETIYGDVLLNITGASIGRSAIVDERVQGGNVNQHVCIIRLNQYQFDPKYLNELLLSAIGQRQIDSFQAGGNREGLNFSQIRSIRIPLPPTLAEQQAIAEALFDADAWIESLEQLIAKKRQIKQGAMQELLTGKRRLPGFSGRWIVRRFGDCLSENPTYGINAAGVALDSRLPLYLRITDIGEDGEIFTCNRVSVDHPDSSGYILMEHDIVFARTGASVGKTYLYKSEHGAMVFAGFLIRARINPSLLNPKFFFSYTHTRGYWKWVRMMSMRSGQPGINGIEYASLEIELPPTVAEQAAIAEIIFDQQLEITELESKLTKAHHLKQALMQQLLTGRIRLVSPTAQTLPMQEAAHG